MLKKQTILAHVSLMAYRNTSALLLSKFQMLFLELIKPWKCGF